MRFYVPACALEYRPNIFFASQITHVCDPSHAQPYHTCTYLASDGIPRLRMNPKDRSLNSTAYRLQILLMPMRLLEPTGIYARPPRFTLPLFSFLGAHFFDPDDLTALFYHPHSTFQKPSVFAHCFSHDNRLSDLKSLQARRQWVFPLGEMRDFEKSFRLVEEVPVNPPPTALFKTRRQTWNSSRGNCQGGVFSWRKSRYISHSNTSRFPCLSSIVQLAPIESLTSS